MLMFALYVPVYANRFSASGLAIQVLEIVGIVPLVLFGLGRAGSPFCGGWRTRSVAA
jgi:hypothetical protein